MPNDYRTGDLKYVQEINRRTIFRVLLDHAPVSRAEISRIARLSPSTVANGVGGLIREGLVAEIGAGSSSGGRKPILLDVVWDAKSVVAVSVEADRVSAALVNLRLDVTRRAGAPMESAAGLTAAIIAAVRPLLAAENTGCVTGIGVSVPGLLDRAQGRIVSAASYDWRDVPLADLLSQAFGLPVFIENDVNAAAIGEQFAGRARGVGTFAYVFVGSAVGAGLVVDGKLLLGAGGNAGEFGHTAVAWDGERCACGGRGCLEQYVRWEAVAGLLRDDGRERSLLIRDAVRAGAAQPDFARTAAILGAGLASLVNVIDPELVILEGIYRSSPEFLEWVRREVERRLVFLRRDPPPIVGGSLGGWASVVGAAVVTLRQNNLWRQVAARPSQTYRPALEGGDGERGESAARPL